MIILLANGRDAPSPQDQPQVEALSWRMLKSPNGELHLVTLRDRDMDRGEVRLTSAITSIDNSARVVTTSSGRQYSLQGPPEGEVLEQQVLCAGAARLGLPEATDVSAWVWSQMSAH